MTRKTIPLTWETKENENMFPLDGCQFPDIVWILSCWGLTCVPKKTC